MNNIVELVNSQVAFFNNANHEQSVRWETESQFAIQLFQANDYLANVALQNQTSAQNAIINVAAIGISLNPALKLAYLVPRKINKLQAVCLDISYMGLLHLAMETGSIRWGQAVVVYSGDKFKLTGLGNMPIHEHDPFSDRGDAVGVYCTVKTSDGDYLTECMGIDDVNKIRARSESFKKGYGPWVSDYGEMVRKTVIKRAYKYWPKVERLSNAIEYLNTQNGEGIEKEPVMPHYSHEEVKVLELESASKFFDEVNELIESMDKCENMESLKSVFKTAYLKTKGHALQKNVQAEYNNIKVKFDV